MGSTICACLAQLILFVVVSTAVPISVHSRSLQLIASELLQIAPQSSSCANAPYPSECRTFGQAFEPISASFAIYDIATSGEVAALVSLIAYETEDFKYQNNYYPGNPGQGTRNMQSAQLNIIYASSIPNLASAVAAITSYAPVNELSAVQLNEVRALLTSNDVYDFGSAAWFMTTQCSANVRSGLQTGTLAGWQAYIGECVGTTTTPARQAIWESAIQVLEAAGLA
ncbi:hypothetical protein MMC19_002946 [Ptychographa xylographoides]|nr:hypothetical protein [Ptychographa xylographoides]